MSLDCSDDEVVRAVAQAASDVLDGIKEKGGTVFYGLRKFILQHKLNKAPFNAECTNETDCVTEKDFDAKAVRSFAVRACLHSC